MADKKLAGKRILMVIAPEEFRDEELLTPKEILEAAGAQVDVASTRMGEAKGMLGAKVSPSLTVQDANASNYQGVIVVGGMGSPSHLWSDTSLHKIISHLNDKGEVVAAICLSGAVLAKAGVLRSKKATVWPDETAINVLKEGQAQYLKEHVVADGNIITADGPEAAKKFGETIVETLGRVRAH
ncbi:MAG: DJ-1/PfpI family protein [Candidatus Obscuribacterales bacterium]|nr:DJ-1/PfpI family protein [Candidatus Obscuribacterales bacterium]